MLLTKMPTHTWIPSFSFAFLNFVQDPVLIHSLESADLESEEIDERPRVDPVTRIAQHVGHTQHTAARRS
jgi:hypothetical protein